MSKKWVALLLVVCIGLAGGVGFMRMNADTEGPELYLPLKHLLYIVLI